MANKKIFGSKQSSIAPIADTVNAAGGLAYNRDKESELAQYICTGTLNQTYYASGEEQLDKVLELAGKCSDRFVAKCAIYGHEVARMKDTPALLCAVLAARKTPEATSLLENIFTKVVTNQKMLRNFVQIVRSGKVGRKSFGSAVKRMITNWLAGQPAEQLFYGAIGQSPSLADVVKMVHPKPEKKEKEAFYAWLLDKEYNKRYLPKLVKEYEKFKAGDSTEVPNVDFRMLTALPLNAEQWVALAENASWNSLRMNLNSFQKHGVFNDSARVDMFAEKLASEKLVRKHNAFPYQLLTTFKFTEGQIPAKLSLALQQAMEIATENVPAIAGEVAVCLDTSSSMSSAITGNRPGATTKMTCVDVAALMAACVVRKNASALVIPFDTAVHRININPLDSVMTNAQKLARHGGGTQCSVALKYLNEIGFRGNTVIYVSDNESWYGRDSVKLWSYSYHQSTGMAEEWEKYRKRNSRAKLVCIDLVPNSTVQVKDRRDVLNVGSFNDAVFDVVARFANGESTNFAQVVNDSIDLDE